MYKEILVPLDGSDLSKAALPHARELARAFGAHLTLLAVIQPLAAVYAWSASPYGMVVATPAVEIEAEREQAAAEQYMNQAKDDLKTQGVNAECLITEGDPGSEICDRARELKADLIVMSTHGRSGVRRWVYGSVAEKVLRGADAPVLLVRAHRET